MEGKKTDANIFYSCVQLSGRTTFSHSVNSGYSVLIKQYIYGNIYTDFCFYCTELRSFSSSCNYSMWSVLFKKIKKNKIIPEKIITAETRHNTFIFTHKMEFLKKHLLRLLWSELCQEVNKQKRLLSCIMGNVGSSVFTLNSEYLCGSYFFCSYFMSCFNFLNLMEEFNWWSGPFKCSPTQHSKT